MLRFHLFSDRYIALQIKNSIRSVFAINPVTTENMDITNIEKSSCYRELTPWAVSKRNGTQRRTKVNPWCMHCTYCGMPKGTCQTEATSNSEKSHNLIFLTASGRQASRQAVNQEKIPLNKK